MYGVSFAIDPLGDIYLVGRLPLHAVTPDEVDRLLGAVLEYADSSFDTILSIGFPTAIRREYAWRCQAGRAHRRRSPRSSTSPATSDPSGDPQYRWPHEGSSVGPKSAVGTFRRARAGWHTLGS